MQVTTSCPAPPGWILNMEPVQGELYAMQCVMLASYLIIVMIRLRRHLPWRGHVLAFLLGDALFTCGFIFLSGVAGPTHRALSDWAVQLIPIRGCDALGAQAFVDQRDRVLEALFFPAGLMEILGIMMPALLAVLSFTAYGQRFGWLRRVRRV